MNSVSLKIFGLTFIGFLLCFTSCKKDEQQGISQKLKTSPSYLIGEVVGFKYAIATNGTITVSDVAASMGGLTMGNTFTMANNSYTVNGGVITLTVTGQDNYNLFIGTVFTDPITITLIYDTSNGSYTISSAHINLN